MTNAHVFSGIFADEKGQRFLRMIHHLCDQAFQDLHTNGMTKNESYYRSCLQRVKQWDSSVIIDEMKPMKKKYADFDDMYRTVYASYVKNMMSAKGKRLIVTPPKEKDFVSALFNNFSEHVNVCNGSYFTNNDILRRRIVCMDAIRDAFFTYLNEDHVVVSDRENTRMSKAPSEVASNLTAQQIVVNMDHTSTEIDQSVASSNRSDARQSAHGDLYSGAYTNEQEQQPQRSVVSSVALEQIDERDNASQPLYGGMSSHQATKASEPEPQRADNDLDFREDVSQIFSSITFDDVFPEDSVSQCNYPRKMMMKKVDEDNNSSTSISLSSVSLAEDGVFRRKATPMQQTRISEASYAEKSADRENAPSVLSQNKASTVHEAQRSYVTNYENDSD